MQGENRVDECPIGIGKVGALLYLRGGDDEKVRW